MSSSHQGPAAATEQPPDFLDSHAPPSGSGQTTFETEQPSSQQQQQEYPPAYDSDDDDGSSRRGGYDVDDDREDYADGDPRQQQQQRPTDYWGRKKARCCDACQHCCIQCCRGFCTPPMLELRSICGCPHGKCYTIMGIMLGAGGLVMSCFYIISCDIERIILLSNGVKPPNAVQIGYGFLSREPLYDETASYMGCMKYPPEERDALFDAWMNSANFFLFLSTLFGLIGFIVLFLASCFAMSQHTFEHWLCWNYVFAALSIPFSYLIFGAQLCSENQCKLGKGGVQAISIFLFWLCCANTVKSFPKALPPDEERQYDENGDEYEEDDEPLYFDNYEDMYKDNPPPQGPSPHDVQAEDEEDEEYDGEVYYDENGNPVDDQGNPLYHYEEDVYDDETEPIIDLNESDYQGRGPNDGYYENQPPQRTNDGNYGGHEPRVGEKDGPTFA